MRGREIFMPTWNIRSLHGAAAACLLRALVQSGISSRKELQLILNCNINSGYQGSGMKAAVPRENSLSRIHSWLLISATNFDLSFLIQEFEFPSCSEELHITSTVPAKSSSLIDEHKGSAYYQLLTLPTQSIYGESLGALYYTAGIARRDNRFSEGDKVNALFKLPVLFDAAFPAA